MNQAEINLPLSVEEHEVLLDAINSYYDIVCENLPRGYEDKLPSDNDYVVRFNALTTAREKILNNWSARFD